MSNPRTPDNVVHFPSGTVVNDTMQIPPPPFPMPAARVADLWPDPDDWSVTGEPIDDLDLRIAHGLVNAFILTAILGVLALVLSYIVWG
jgi:hypothetical protein